MAHTPGHESKAEKDEREEKERIEMAAARERQDKAQASASRPLGKTGWGVQGYDEKAHEDVLRRANRKPIGADGKPTVTVDGAVVTVVMPNHASYRLTLGEREVTPEVPIVPKAAQKDLPKGASIPETIKPEDVKKWEYQPAPAKTDPAKG